MNVLLITPFYAIDDNLGLKEDNRAIHYFTKEWAKEKVDIKVIHTHFNSIKRFNDCKTMVGTFLKNKYSYSMENVNVNLLIFNKLYKGLPKLNRRQQSLVIKEIEHHLNNKTEESVIVFHFPTIYLEIIEYIKSRYSKKIIPVYHMLDIKNIKMNKNMVYKIKELTPHFYKVGFRSKRIEKDFLYYTNIQKKIQSFIVYSGVPDKIIENNFVLNHRRKKKNVKFLFVGKLIPQKNADILIYSLKRLDRSYNFTLTIIGEGPEQNKLKLIVESLEFKNSIKFIGKTTRDEVFNYMRTSDVFVLPSVHETLGLVYLEAMAHNCITIGTKDEGIDGIIEHEKNGFLVESNSKVDLEKILVKTLNMGIEEKTEILDRTRNTICEMKESKLANDYLKELGVVCDNE